MAALSPLADVKVHLGISGSADDALLNVLREAAGDVIARHCGRSFAGGSFTEYFDGGSRVLILANYPVASVASVRVDPGRFFTDDSILPTDRYVVRTDRGLIVLTAGGPFLPSARPNTYPHAIKVIYSTATDAIPADILRANAELIGHWYRQVKTWVETGQINVRQVTDGTAVTEYPWGQSGGFDLPVGVMAILNGYRTHAA